jgi:hypothetical protein
MALAQHPGRRREATEEGTMKSQRAEEQRPQEQASWQSLEFGRSQPDQPRRRDQGRVDEEEHRFGKGATCSSSAGPRPIREEYDTRFLLMWLLGVPGLVVLTWSLVSG